MFYHIKNIFVRELRSLEYSSMYISRIKFFLFNHTHDTYTQTFKALKYVELT